MKKSINEGRGAHPEAIRGFQRRRMQKYAGRLEAAGVIYRIHNGTMLTGESPSGEKFAVYFTVPHASNGETAAWSAIKFYEGDDPNGHGEKYSGWGWEGTAGSFEKGMERAMKPGEAVKDRAKGSRMQASGARPIQQNESSRSENEYERFIRQYWLSKTGLFPDETVSAAMSDIIEDLGGADKLLSYLHNKFSIKNASIIIGRDATQEDVQGLINVILCAKASGARPIANESLKETRCDNDPSGCSDIEKEAEPCSLHDLVEAWQDEGYSIALVDIASNKVIGQIWRVFPAMMKVVPHSRVDVII